MDWNAKALSHRFRYAAEDAERYLKEIEPKAAHNTSYRVIFDETLAKYYVFNHMHGKTFLDSRNQLIGELLRMKLYEIPSPGAYERGRFDQFRVRHIDQLIAEFSSEVV